MGGLFRAVVAACILSCVFSWTLDYDFQGSGNNAVDAYVQKAFDAVQKKMEKIITGPVLPGVNYTAGSVPPGAVEGWDNVTLWDEIQLGDYVFYDMTVLVSVGPLDGAGKVGEVTTLAESEVIAIRNITEVEGDLDGIPYFCIVFVDVANVPDLSFSELKNVLLHEVTHCVGFVDYIFDMHALLEDVDDSWVFMGPFALAEYQKLKAGDQTIGYIPLDNASRSHWDETIFGTEYMTPLEDPKMPISAVTLGALMDIGLEVNMTQADSNYTLPVQRRVEEETQVKLPPAQRPKMIIDDARKRRALESAKNMFSKAR